MNGYLRILLIIQFIWRNCQLDNFPCTKCGLCCTTANLGKWLDTEYIKTLPPVLQFVASKFPYQLTDDGACEMLKDGLCSVYDDRPLLCNIKLLAKLSGDESFFYILNALHCNKMIDDAGLGEEYLISFRDFDINLRSLLTY